LNKEYIQASPAIEKERRGGNEINARRGVEAKSRVEGEASYRSA
jgi:hypothetical protein